MCLLEGFLLVCVCVCYRNFFQCVFMCVRGFLLVCVREGSSWCVYVHVFRFLQVLVYVW